MHSSSPTATVTPPATDDPRASRRAPADHPGELDLRFRRIRDTTTRLTAPLGPEDMVVQVVEETSPAKWHLAHTTWFFETFVLEAHEPDFRPFHQDFRVLFNSYYRAVGDRHPRPARGLLTRPSIEQVKAYRRDVDERITALLESGSAARTAVAELVALGLQHEQQHQELILMDVKRLLHANPLRPAYDDRLAPGAPGASKESVRAPADAWIDVAGGIVHIGHARGDGFAFDNEEPRHRRLLEPFQLAAAPVTNARYVRFIEDGGYRRPELWLDEGWTAATSEGWSAPLYWERGEDGRWRQFTFGGLQPLDLEAPVTHVSFFEAEAFARWAGARLPTEAEWEAAAARHWEESLEAGQFLDEDSLHPVAPAPPRPGRAAGLAGGTWEWTRSSHEPYPGYAVPEGLTGEYNGKFMSGTHVLRGGSCITPRDHVRVTYRNFFRPGARWAFSGIRLARGGEPRDSRTDDDRRPAGATPSASSDAPSNLRPTVALGGDDRGLEVEAVRGLSRPRGRKGLSPRHLYDATGSRLFERICELDAYELTRTELGILEREGAAIAAAVGSEAVLIEPGAGASHKTEVLLRALHEPRMVVPVEISGSALAEAAERLARTFPTLVVQPICGDFTRGLEALGHDDDEAASIPGEHRLVFCPGSTIGNFSHDDRVALLRGFARAARPGGAVLVGYDLVKEPARMVAAYDDPEGVSAAFAMNLLTRLNRELDAGFDLDAFAYEARWNPDSSSIEMNLVARRPQVVRIAGRTIRIEAGERLRTEHATKFTPTDIESEAAAAGLMPAGSWTDPGDGFALVLFRPADPAPAASPGEEGVDR